jgi:Pyruvate/2-oxoacid:ferredoxin oxidoreductase delta subunit/DNA-binding transcriptional ArsR family regulator
MTDEIFSRLADAMDRLPNGFPRTSSNVELKILKKIFSPEDAALASHLTRTYESVEQIASRAELSPEDVSKQLFKMTRRGMVWLDKQDGQVLFRLAPFVVGVYEASLELMDHELAHLTEEYFANGGVAGIMGVEPSLHRVVPAHAAVKTEWVLPYDDVRAILLKSKTFNVRDCICRVQQAQIGDICEFPVNVCLSFSESERASPRPGDISQAEALALLDKCEEVGLVHTVNNVMKGVGYVCNCCGCCCGILRGITEFGLEKSVAFANYYAVIDPMTCNNCGTCISRCQVNAITEGDGYSVVDLDHCIGCGLCVTGCPNDVAVLVRKPEAEMIHPPADFSVWEHERLHNRGMAL